MSRTPNPSDWSSRARGRWGEDRAAARYRSLGFDLVGRNWRSPERELPGELDVIARRGDLVVFCEVKARGRSGRAWWAVREEKQARVRSLAAVWLRSSGLDGEVDVRFDVIAIDGVRLEHYEAAF